MPLCGEDCRQAGNQRCSLWIAGLHGQDALDLIIPSGQLVVAIAWLLADGA